MTTGLAAGATTDVALIVPLLTTSGACTVTLPAGPPTTPAWLGVALAWTVPLLFTRVLASKMMRPPLRDKPLACNNPPLLTTPLRKRATDCADKMINPPGALMACWLSTRVLMLAGVTRRPVRPRPVSN